MSRVKPTEVVLPYTPRPAFLPFHTRTQRWACLVAHRRAGKTVAAINDMLRAALLGPATGRYAYVAPYRTQAKAVAWDYLRQFSAPIRHTANEAELDVTLVNGARVRLFGADNDDAMRGLGFDGVYLDEHGDMRPSVWNATVRPTLSDRKGWAVFGGTPRGKNHFYAVAELAARTPEEWCSVRLPASTSGILDADELASARAQMSPDAYAAEYECAFDAAILGAYYGTELQAAEADGRLTVVPADPARPVHTAWDLGYRDDTAIWWFQVAGAEVHVLDYYAVAGASIAAVAKVVADKPYRYRAHYLPHDARARTLAANGQTIVEQLAHYLGASSLRVVPKLSLEDGIQAARQVLPRCWFDATACADGLEALRQYQREYDPDRQVFRVRPRHDWTSHAADAFRMLALAWREEPSVDVPVEERVLLVGAASTYTLNDAWADAERTVRRVRV